jgi:superfamily I DNA/RNA helicase
LLDDLHFRNYLRSSENDPKLARRRLDNVDEFLDSLSEWEAEGGTSMESFLTRIALDHSTPESEPDYSAAQLMTLHSSKGLEFPVVFLVGMEEGYLPHRRAKEEPGGIEEERRLCYVGITRAKKHLTLTRARTRKRYGSEVDRKPSRFLEEIPGEVVQTADAARSGGLREKRKEMGLKYLQAFRASLE